MNKLKEYNSEYKRQKKEHPKLPAWAVRLIASDHVKLGGKKR